MKLQNLGIIFIIIIIPIVLIFTLYLNLETKTITLQTDYDAKLIEATKEAVNAFEINTTEWNDKYSTLANVKRQDLISSINVFTEGMANKLGIGGSSKESILTYIPAIVFTMYDGYYIYAPTYVPQTITDNNGVQLFYYDTKGYEGTQITNSATQNIEGTIFAGKPIYFAKSGEGTSRIYNDEPIYYTTDVTKAEKIYKHVLKTFVPYTAIYEHKDEIYVINYTLDNYIRIYGKDKMKEGYIVENAYSRENGWKIKIPINSVSSVYYNGKQIQLEKLSENIAIKNNETKQIEIKEYPYIYNSNNDKRYYDKAADRFFIINNKYEQVYLSNGVEVGSSLAEYKKVLVRTDKNNSNYIELYQMLNNNDANEDDTNWYYIDTDNQYKQYLYGDDSVKYIKREEDCSAINYYVECFDFNVWLRETAGIDLNEGDIRNIVSLKKEEICKNINENLNLAISNYSANSRIDYKLPELSDSDWEQALSNVSMIVFFQGKKIGLKTYNNYAIVTSAENNEFVSDQSLYYVSKNFDKYYHRRNCSSIVEGVYTAYRSNEFKAQSVNKENFIFYKHANKHNGETYNLLECFDCIVNRNNMNDQAQDKYKEIRETAIARERYIQMQRTKLIK